MRKLKFYWSGTDEQLAALAKLARITGHGSIRELFGTLVSSGLKTLSDMVASASADSHRKEYIRDEQSTNPVTAGGQADVDSGGPADGGVPAAPLAGHGLPSAAGGVPDAASTSA